MCRAHQVWQRHLKTGSPQIRWSNTSPGPLPPSIPQLYSKADTRERNGDMGAEWVVQVPFPLSENQASDCGASGVHLMRGLNGNRYPGGQDQVRNSKVNEIGGSRRPMETER